MDEARRSTDLSTPDGHDPLQATARLRRDHPTHDAKAAIDTELLTLAEVASRLKLKAETLKRWSRDGRFPRLLRLSAREYRIRRDDLEAWLSGKWVESPERSSRRRWLIRRAAFASGRPRRRGAHPRERAGTSASS